MTTMNQTNPILGRLTAALEAKTNAALVKLASLDTAILDAFEHAEQAAKARINDVLGSIQAGVSYGLSRFEDRILDLVADAVEQSLFSIGQRLDDMLGSNSKPTALEVYIQQANNGDTAASVAALEACRCELDAQETPSIAEESENWARLTDDDQAANEQKAQEDGWRSVAEINAEYEQVPEAEQATALGGDIFDPVEIPMAIPVATIAAQVVATERPAMLPDEDDGDNADSDEESGVSPDSGIRTTFCGDGLHLKTGAGRGTRYTEVDFPDPGVRYWVRDGKRWRQVRYLGQ